MSQSIHTASIHVDISQALTATDDLAREVSELQAKVNSAGEQATQAAEAAANKTTQASEQTRDAKQRPTKQTNQVQGIASALGDLAAPAINFEQSMADLSAITGSVGEELEDLSKTARRVGVESGLGASESARAFAILAGQIDVPIEQLKVLQEQTILLAQAGALPLEEASNALAGTINQFGLEASEAARIVNVLAAGSRAGGP